MRRLLAVLGQDVSRSLSPFLHDAAARALGIDVAYVPVSCATEAAFDRALAALGDLKALGANVTIPYKLRALESAAGASPIARAIGAANTLTFRPAGGFGADNTDGPALVALFDALPKARLERVQILGAGGSARAAAWALAELGVRETHVCARSRAAECAALCSGQPHPLEPVRGATLVISSLPSSTNEGLVTNILDRLIDADAMPMVFDLTYEGIGAQSALSREARARGLEASDGLAMVVEQAARALALWTGGELSRILASMREAADL